MTTLLKVTKIENAVAENGVRFQKVYFDAIKFMSDETQVATGRSGYRGLFDSNVLPDGREIKAHPLFNKLSVNGNNCWVDGDIVTLNTTPYTVGENTVTKWTGVVFAGEDAVAIANRGLVNKGACVVDEHGQPTKEVSFAPVTKPEVKVTSKFE